MKETILFSSTILLLIFEGFYLMVNPTATVLSSVAIGTLLGFVASGIIVAVLSGVTALTVGLSDVANRTIFITSVIFNLMFQYTFDFWIGAYHAQLPVGLGILYPTAWNIFVVSDSGFMGYLGLMIITGLALSMLLCAVLMGAGTYE